MNQVSATLSQADLDAIAQSIDTLYRYMPFLIDLVGKERSAYPKMGDKSRAFVAKALDLASKNAEFLPRSFDVEEMRKDVALYEHLYSVLMSLKQLQDMVDDTCLVVGSEAYSAALTVYNAAKANGHSSNGLEPLINDMAQRFQRSRKPKVEPDIP
jgi:hypothetical protein